MLLLTIKANKDKITKIKHFENDQEWIFHGTPVYSSDVHPDNFKDSFFLDTVSWIESPMDETFNLNKKSFTITWWENSAGNPTGECGSINFGVNQYFAQSYLLLSYATTSNCYASHVANSGNWAIFDSWNMGGFGINQWINYAIVSEFSNNIHTFRIFRNGKLFSTRTSSLTFPDVGSTGKMYLGAYGGERGPNRYLQNIRFYDEPLFDNDYDIYEFENYGDNSIILNNLKPNSDSN